MNKKQLFFLWLGVAAFVFFGFVFVDNNNGYLRSGHLFCLFVCWTCVIVVTSAFIYTFRDKDKTMQKMHETTKQPLSEKYHRLLMPILIGLLLVLVLAGITISCLWTQTQDARTYVPDNGLQPLSPPLPPQPPQPPSPP